MIELEKYYSQENWIQFAKHFQTFEVQKNLKALLKGNEELAKVIFGILDKESINWIHSSIPALDNLKPIDCLENENLIERLKVCLTRMQA